MQKRCGLLFVVGAVLLASCAGLGGTLRPVIPVGEIPSGEYEVRVLAALVPTIQPDGEVIAAVLYTQPTGRRVEVWDSPRSWLWEHSLGKGNGREHVALVKSPANYEIVRLTSRDGQPIGYALLHRAGVHATLQDWDGKTVLFLSTLNFIDPNYIRPDNGRD